MCLGAELNCRPIPLQGSALPTELPKHLNYLTLQPYPPVTTPNTPANILNKQGIKEHLDRILVLINKINNLI